MEGKERNINIKLILISNRKMTGGEERTGGKGRRLEKKGGEVEGKRNKAIKRERA